MPVEEEKMMENEAKRKKERQGNGGAKISAPTHLDLVNPKKNKKKSLSQSFQVSSKIQNFKFKIFIPKFSISHSQCPNSKLKS